MKIKVMKLLLLLIVPTLSMHASKPAVLSLEEEGAEGLASFPEVHGPNQFDAMVAVAGVAPAASAADADDGVVVDPNAPEIPPLRRASPQPSPAPQPIANAAAAPKASSMSAIFGELLNSALTKAKDGYVYFTTSDGRKLLMKLDECAKTGKPFASENPAQDTAMIALGVQDSRIKGKKGNLKLMIDGLARAKAEVDKKSRRALRQFAKEQRDQELDETSKELKLKMEELCEWYAEKVQVINEKEKLRQQTYQFAECDSEDDEAVELEKQKKFAERLAAQFAKPLCVVKKKASQHDVKADREHKPKAAAAAAAAAKK